MLGKPCISQYEIYPISGYFSKLGAHQTMLADKTRLDAFYKALKKTIIPGKSVVLDIGTGTGILAMIAAKLGAKKVFAVDKSSIINIARKIAKDNNLHRKIKFIKGYSTDLKLDDKIDVIVSETIGFTGLEENIVDIMLDARKRFGHKNTILIPSEISVYCAPTNDVTVKALTDFWKEKISGFSYNRLHRLSKNNLYGRLLIPQETLLSNPQKLLTYKLGEDYLPGKPTVAKFELTYDGNVTGFAMWFSAILSNSQELNSYNPNNHWQQVFLPLTSSVKIKKNETIELRLNIKKSRGYISYTWLYKITNRTKKIISAGKGSTNSILEYSTK